MTLAHCSMLAGAKTAETAEEVIDNPPPVTTANTSIPPEQLRAEFDRLVQGSSPPDDRAFKAYCELKRRDARVDVAARIKDHDSTRCYWSADGFAPYETPANHRDLQLLERASTEGFRRCLPHLMNLDPLWSLWAPLYSELGDAEFHLFSAIVAKGTIRSLSCIGPGFNDKTATCLARASQLRELRLIDTMITEKSLAYIQAMYDLETLVISGTPLAGEVLSENIRHLNLQYLDVSGTRMNNKALSCVSSMTNLKILSLKGTAITGEGMQHLQRLTKLRHLDLSYTSTGHDCVEGLSQVTSLQYLNIYRTHFIPEDVERLQTRLPSCDVKERP